MGIDWNSVLEIVLKVIGYVIAALVTTLASIVFAKLKTKIKESRITAFILQSVKAAEQMFPNTGKKMGKEKYAYVVNQTLAKFPTLTDNEYLKNLIEGAVFKVSEEVRQIANLNNQKNNNDISKSLTSF